MNIIKKAFNKFIHCKKTKMEQEILEQSDIVFELIKKYINKDYSVNIELPDNIVNIVLIASGSSFNSASIIAEFFRNKININAQTFYSSEVSLNENFIVDNTALYIFISQSGETGDTNLALNIIKQRTDKIFVITNSKHSTIWNNSKFKILSYAGEEKSISSTKSVSSQLFCLFLVALKLMQIKNIKYINYIDELINVPEYIKNAFLQRKQIKKDANILMNYDNAVILASGMFYPLAKEGALKIKETSYINVNAYPTGEFLHGHIAVLNKKCAVITIVNSKNIQFAIDILMKINNNFKSDIVIISSLPINKYDKNDFIQTNSRNDIEFLFSSLIILQLLALETANLLDRNIDKPQGLTKIVK